MILNINSGSWQPQCHTFVSQYCGFAHIKWTSLDFKLAMITVNMYDYVHYVYDFWTNQGSTDLEQTHVTVFVHQKSQNGFKG